MNNNTMKVMLIITILLAIATIAISTIRNKGNRNIVKQINYYNDLENKK